MSDRPTASTITDQQLDELYDELAALRQVARGYCPICGRGDAAPTVTDWEQQRQRAKKAESALTRVRKACDSVRAADQGHNPAVGWVVMRVLEAIDARLVSGGLPPVPNGSATPCPACARADQAGLTPAEQHPTCARKEQP